MANNHSISINDMITSHCRTMEIVGARTGWQAPKTGKGGTQEKNCKVMATKSTRQLEWTNIGNGRHFVEHISHICDMDFRFARVTMARHWKRFSTKHNHSIRSTSSGLFGKRIAQEICIDVDGGWGNDRGFIWHARKLIEIATPWWLRGWIEFVTVHATIAIAIVGFVVNVISHWIYGK